MRRILLAALLLLLCAAVPCAFACAEDIADYAALAEAFNSAKEGAILTLGADLIRPEDSEIMFSNASKAVVTIDGNGHSIDSLILTDGTLVLEDICFTKQITVTSEKKSNTTSLTIGADASVGHITGGVLVFQGALGTISIRNHGKCGQIVSNGCAAEIEITNTGLIEGPLGIGIADLRYDENYQLTINGDVAIVNDGVIRGLTSAGVVLALNTGTDAKLTGSGYVEGPCGVAVFCQEKRSNVTIDHDMRTCNQAFADDPARYADFWYILGKRGVELGLPRTTGDATLKPEYQRKYRLAQIAQVFNHVICEPEDMIGRALVMPHPYDEKLGVVDAEFNGKITVKGRLYGEEGLMVLPDMNKVTGSLSIKAEIDEASPSKLIDIHYVQNVGSITAEKWGKKLKTTIKEVFPSGLPESVIVRTWGIRHDADTNGLIYTTGWRGYAMDELRATQAEGKGKWSVTTHQLPSPGGEMTRYELGDKLCRAPDGTIMLLESDVTPGDLSYYYNWYTFAGGDIVIDGQGHSFVDVSEDKRREMYPVEYTMNDGMTLRNFNVFDGLQIAGGKYTKGKAVLERISNLRGLNLINVSATLANVTTDPDCDADIRIDIQDERITKATVTLEESTALYGFADISAGRYADHPNQLNIVIDGIMSRRRGYAWCGSLSASDKSTLKITGSGVLGIMGENDPDRGFYEVHAYDSGKVIIDMAVANLKVIAGADKDAYISPKGTVQIGGSCRFLTVECDDDANKCTVTVTASGLEVFRVLMTIDDRAEPMTDKEAKAYIKKNGPKLTYSKATDSQGAKIAPTYRITGADGVLLWEGMAK